MLHIGPASRAPVAGSRRYFRDKNLLADFELGPVQAGIGVNDLLGCDLDPFLFAKRGGDLAGVVVCANAVFVALATALDLRRCRFRAAAAVFRRAAAAFQNQLLHFTQSRVDALLILEALAVDFFNRIGKALDAFLRRGMLSVVRGARDLLA